MNFKKTLTLKSVKSGSDLIKGVLNGRHWFIPKNMIQIYILSHQITIYYIIITILDHHFPKESSIQYIHLPSLLSKFYNVNNFEHLFEVFFLLFHLQ